MAERRHCKRCRVPVEFVGHAPSDAQVLRRARRADDVCVNCAMTGFLKDTTPLNVVLERKGPSVLLEPAVQAMVAQVLAAGDSDASPDEIDWNAVLANWDLPVAKGAGYG